MPGVGADFRPLEPADGLEAEQAVQRQFPGAVTVMLSARATDVEHIRKLFMDWLGWI